MPGEKSTARLVVAVILAITAVSALAQGSILFGVLWGALAYYAGKPYIGGGGGLSGQLPTFYPTQAAPMTMM